MFYRLAALFAVAAGLLSLRASGGAREESHEFWVGAHSALNLESYRGNINILPAENSRITVEVHLEAPGTDEKKVNERLARAEVGMSQDGSTVKVAITDPKHRKFHFDWIDDGRLDITITVHVPKHCAVNVSTQDGGIESGNVSADITARARAGTISLRQVDGYVDAETKTGGLIVSRCSGTVHLVTTQGDIQVGRVGGKANLRTSSGDVELQQAVGGADVFAEAGEIVVGFPKDFTGDADLRTNGGNITAKFDLSARATIGASSVWGKVKSSLPLVTLAGGNNESSFKATLNGGGPMITVHASGGHAKLLPGTFIETP